MEDEKLLLAEYREYSEAYWRNEEAGEKRVNFIITLTTAIIAAIVALYTKHSQLVFLIAPAGLLLTVILGFSTFLRMLQRNRVTDEYLARVRYLREQLRSRSEGLGKEYVLPSITPRHRLLRGGLAVTVALMNSLLLAAITAMWMHENLNGIVVAAIFFISFVAQSLCIRPTKFKDESSLGIRSAKYEEEISQTFRAGVGSVILNQAGEVLALERRDIPDQWQMPQGGLKIGECPLVAVKREIMEETGIEERDLHKIFSVDRLLAYELPKKHRNQRIGRGQVQYWFVFEYRGTDERITLGDKKEFCRWEWIAMEELNSRVVAFKKPVYRELTRYLAQERKRFT